MNDSLIKQLELALQVERGEVLKDEIQVSRLGTDIWHGVGKGHVWDYCLYEYRRKPKPLECEVVVIDGQIVGFNGSTPLSDELRQKALVVKMKETIE